jgi:hypothetical protein
LREVRFVNLALKNHELLTEQSILDYPVRFDANQVGGSAENHRMVDGMRKMQESLFMGGDETDKQLGQPMAEGEHVN